MKQRVPNPFNPNSVVSHSLFAGRTNQLNTVLSKISLVKQGTPSSFFFIGERGIGKTALASLIMYLSQKKDKDFYDLNLLSAYYSVAKGQKISDCLQAVLNELTDDMPSTMIASLAGRLGNLLQNGKFSIGAFGGQISVETRARPEQEETTVRDQVVSILSNIIVTIRGGRAASKDGIVLVLDEVNNLVNMEDCAQLIRGIVTTLNVKDRGNISFVLIGYDSTERSFFMGDESSRRHFDEIRLNPMPVNEAEDVLKKGFTAVGMTWSDGALTANIQAAGGFPHSIQLLGHNLCEVDTDGHIGSDDWSAALTRTAIELQTKEFANMYSFRGKKKQREQLLDSLVNGLDGICKTDLSKKCPEIKNIYRLIPRLKEEGSIVEDEDEKLFISSHLLRVAILLSNFRKNSD